MLTVVVPDKQVDDVVQTIIDTNQTGKPGDGKIFVLPMADAVRVRTGESGRQGHHLNRRFSPAGDRTCHDSQAKTSCIRWTPPTSRRKC